MRQVIITAPDISPDDMFIAFFHKSEEEMSDVATGDIIYIENCEASI